jgi:2-C-methyl-D-erythritol 4-phosphate cytidylyltransferase
VIAAAGSGERLGAGGPKAFVQLGGRPMLAWSLAAFRRSASVDRAVIAAPPRRESEAAQLASADSGEGELEVQVVTGGEHRSQSVAAAMERVDAEIVAIHDAARPLVTPELIDSLVDSLAERPDAAGVIAAAPLTDTVKRAREPCSAKGDQARGGPTVARTESRDHLWSAQTPQTFRTEPLREALSADAPRLAAATDEAMLVEQAGGKVLIREGPNENLKVTTPLDLQLAELLLAGRR